MSGGTGEFVRNNWHGLPINEALLSPKWIKKHPREAVGAAMVAATVFSGGSAAGLWGAGAAAAAEAAAASAAAAGAAGVGAAEAGALGAGALGAAELGGAAAGAGALGSAAPAGLLGATEGAGLLGGEMATGLLGPEALAYGGELASVGETGGTMLGGASPQNLSLGSGVNWSKAMHAMRTANGLMQLANGAEQPKPPPPMRRTPPSDTNSDEILARLRRLYGIK